MGNKSETEKSCYPSVGNEDGVRYFSLARHALVEGLRCLTIRAGQSVLMPEFICRDLLASLHAVGARPLYYPVNQRLQPATEPAGWPIADAVIAVNYFGFAQPLGPFNEYCRRTGARLVEDNAHGFLSKDESGEWLGMRGDVGLFSLRKTFLMIDGAALVARSDSVSLGLPEQLRLVVTPPPRSLQFRRALRALTGSRQPELIIAKMLRCLRYQLHGYAIVPPAINAETFIPGISAPAEDLFHVLKKQNYQKETARRRRLFEQLLTNVHGSGCRPVFDSLPDGTVPYGFPVFANNQEIVTAWASRFGLDCFHWPDLPDALASTAPAHYRCLYVVNFL